MKKIPLSNGGFTLIDAEDYCAVCKFIWRKDNQGYVSSFKTVNGKTTQVLLHRLINSTPKGFHTDHINGDKLDNRKANLRTATNQENSGNRYSHKGSKSKYKGVCIWPNGKAYAQIRVDGKQIHLGTYETQEEAACVYDENALIYFGKFAKLNNIK